MMSPKYNDCKCCFQINPLNKLLHRQHMRSVHIFTALYLCFWCCYLLDFLPDRNMNTNTMTNAYQKSQLKNIVCHAHNNLQILL